MHNWSYIYKTLNTKFKEKISLIKAEKWQECSYFYIGKTKLIFIYNKISQDFLMLQEVWNL